MTNHVDVVTKGVAGVKSGWQVCRWRRVFLCGLSRTELPRGSQGPERNELEEGKSYRDYLNPDSLITNDRCLAEPSLAKAKPGERFQFLRVGYFCADQDSKPDKPVFNRIVTLKDSWAKQNKR